MRFFLRTYAQYASMNDQVGKTQHWKSTLNQPETNEIEKNLTSLGENGVFCTY